MFKGFGYMELWANNTLTLRQKCLIEKRIACPEAGYSEHEALYFNVEEYEQFTGKDFERDYKITVAAGAGAY